MSRTETLDWTLLVGRWRYRIDCLLFSRQRMRYFRYLSTMLEGLQGRATLADIFMRDARRYGRKTARGRLSAVWSRMYPVAGGDLSTMWHGCFPEAELDVLRMAQLAGNRALIRGFHDLSEAIALARKASGIVTGALGAAALALLVLVGLVLAVPFYTVPVLKQVFSALPEAYYGLLTQRLFSFADFVGQWWLVFLLLAFSLSALCFWSVGNLTGQLRNRLDQHWIWRFARVVAGLRFLSILLIVLARHDGVSVQLRPALAHQANGGSRWLRWHIRKMLQRIDSGVVQADTFNTGLLDRESYWYFDDMCAAHGLVPALQMVQEHLAGQMLADVARQAQVGRWLVLLLCLACLLGLVLWHYGVIDELRRSLMMFYSN